MTYLKLLIVVAAFGLTACISSSETSGPSSPEVVSGGVVTDGSFTEGSAVLLPQSLLSHPHGKLRHVYGYRLYIT